MTATSRSRTRKSPRPFPRRGHDHDSCVSAAVARADALCRKNGLALTALRRRVLELVWRSHEPVGAYQILRRLRRRGRASAPPTVYRALDFLLENGFVHRIESQQAYVGCAHPDSGHAGQFLICGNCGSAAELADARIRRAVARGAAAVGFSVQRQTVEVVGLCPRCKPRRRRTVREKRGRR
jgi:Fur family zinc uptake transcriptional regulator